MEIKKIENHGLTLENVPRSDAPFGMIVLFGYTFGSYAEFGTVEQCAEVANKRKPETLTELRVCLFFEQRRAHHTGASADAEDQAYQRSLITQIRSKVAAGDLS